MNLSKILAIKTRSMGDTALLTAPLIELTRAFPQATIDVVVTDSWAPLLQRFPGIHKVWTIPPSSESRALRAKAIACLALTLRKQKYDGVINFHASSSSARLAHWTGAQIKSIHFHGHRDKNRFSTVNIPGKGTLKPIIERDMDALRALGLHIPAGRSPQIFLQPSEIEEAKRLIQKLNFKTPLLGLSLGASRPSKSWPIERFAALAIEWCRKAKGSVIAFAGPTEDHLIHEFLNSIDDLLSQMIPDTQDRSLIRKQMTALNQLPLRMLAATLQQLSVLAGNDSGPRHLAVAVNTPTVTLFGPENPFEWHPYPRERHPYVFIKDLPCRKDADPEMPPWCGLSQCIVEEHKCMRMIGVDQVFALCHKVKQGELLL